ncbi:MAG: CHAT domain-containing protein [Acidobacteria bacterium]|nr:CHAT domain-containing protein [Acidobacteriota bacterium]
MPAALRIPRRPPLGFATTLTALLCLWPGGGYASQPGERPARGVVVDAVQPGSAAAVAGLRRDDVILGWRRVVGEGVPGGDGASEGTLLDPWAFEPFALEAVPRGPVTLEVWREGETVRVELPIRTSRLGVSVSPVLERDLCDEWRQWIDRLLATSAGTVESPDLDGSPVFTRLATQGRELDAAWLRLRLADHLMGRRAFDRAAAHLEAAFAAPGVTADPTRRRAVLGSRFDLALRRSRWEEAAEAVDAALAADEGSADTLMRASWRLRRAALLRQQGRHDEAHREAEAALAVRRSLAAGSWDEADALAEMGRIAVARRRLDEAAPHFEQALAMVGRAQTTIESVRLSYALADVDWRRGRLPEAEKRVRALLDLTGDLAPDSVDQARNLNLLGILRSQSGDLPAAGQAFEASRAIHARLDPGGVDEASALNNLGIAAMQRGRYAEAESFYRRSLEMKERLRLPPLDRASTLGNLGLMSIERRDTASARDYLSRALALAREAAPGSLQEGGVLSNLARAERMSGNLAEAERLAREGLAIRAKLAPGTVLHAFTLTELGKVHEAAGALDAAADAHRQALAIREQLAPDGSNVADSLDALGRLAARRGDAAEAARLHDRAGSIWQRVAPGSVYEGLNLMAQAGLDAAGGRPEEARERYARAIEIFDGLTGGVGGAFDTQADFRGGLAAFYAEYAAFLVAQGDAAEAFRVSERARARVFLTMLSERDVAIRDEAPPALDEARRTLAAEYERIQAELATLSPARDAARIDERVGRLRDVRLKLAATQSDIARASPRMSALALPAPMDVDSARRLLPPGTMAIAYLVGDARSHGFLVSADAFDVFEIPWGREALADRVDRLLRLIERRDASLEPLHALSAELYRGLVLPAERTLAASQRLLVVPDGALHQLPFAALVRERPGSRPAPQYLVEWRPVHQVPSLTLYGRLAPPAPGGAGRARLLAVGSPVYAKGDGELPPLPGSRREVVALQRLYGDRASTLLGGEASETRVRQAMADADIVHVAVHGLVNAPFPLDSALAFSTPGAGAGDNGLLQAWEIFEQVRLRARLVVLSACDTAGSRESGGEGLLGLTRAFQFAGVPAVVASLWRVPDDVTPDLMREFHRHVRRGLYVDDALARAQRAMLRRPATAHPYNWAAFVMSGRN